MTSSKQPEIRTHVREQEFHVPFISKGADGARGCVHSVLAVQKNMGKHSLVCKVISFAEGQTEMTADRISGLLTLNVSEEMILQK